MSPAAGRRQPTEDTGRVRIPLDVSFRLRSGAGPLTGEVPVVSGAQFTPLAGWEESAS